MPQDITNQNDIPMAMITADISSQDVEIVMGLIKLLLQHNLDQHNQLDRFNPDGFNDGGAE